MEIIKAGISKVGCSPDLSPGSRRDEHHESIMARKKSAARRAREKTEEAKNIIGDSEIGSQQLQAATEQDETRSDSSDESQSEEEDEYGELLTENIEQLIQEVMKTLKSDPKKLLDPKVKFFDEANVTLTKKSGDKPMYLKDYHRLNLLSGDYKNDDNDHLEQNEYGTVDGEKPFVVVEREERNKLLEDIKSAFNDEDGGQDDEFLKKKENTQVESDTEPLLLPDPNINSEQFLSSFINSQAWIPSKHDKVIDLDAIDQDDEQDFDDAVENFEKAYNFRYEDPNSAEIVSYARSQASLRRGKTNSRKRARDKKQALKEQEKYEVDQALQKKKTAKLNKVFDRLAKIKEAVGDDVDDLVIERVFGDSLLNDDFDDADWDGKMSEIFNEQYYGSEIVKPEWDEDDEITVYYKEGGKDDNGEEYYEEEPQEKLDEKLNANEDTENEDAINEDLKQQEKSKSKSKREKLNEKKSAKKEKESLKEKAKIIVELNTTKIQEEVEEERGRLRSDEMKFKYREVSPESYGLTTRDIFLADDQELNQYFSIKKFAPYRPKEQALKDKRKHTKKKQVQHWRYQVFRNVNGQKKQPTEKEDEIWIPMEDTHKTKKQTRK